MKYKKIVTALLTVFSLATISFATSCGLLPDTSHSDSNTANSSDASGQDVEASYEFEGLKDVKLALDAESYDFVKDVKAYKNFEETSFTVDSAAVEFGKAGEYTVTYKVDGDSISNAANSSGEGQFPPYEKAWYLQALENVRKQYHNENITLINNSRSGYGSVWGAENALEKVVDADLLIVAFGMNDGADNLPCEDFEANIRTILRARKRADCNAILISSILPNPDNRLFRLSLRKEYGEALKRICREENCAFMDMLALSEYYLQTKKYCEISGNNFNHPNDFIYRFYADACTHLLTQEEI